VRFLISVIDDSTESGTPEEMEAIDEFNDHLVADGHWILACGLGAPSTSVLIDNRGGANILTHGPLVDLPEFVSGFKPVTLMSCIYMNPQSHLSHCLPVGPQKGRWWELSMRQPRDRR